MSYRLYDPAQNEIEETVGDWLRATIQRLEEERTAVQRGRNKQTTLRGKTLKGTPLYQKQHPKCANPVCPTAFHWTGGSKFLRFRLDPASAWGRNTIADPPTGMDGAKHYWLCEHCSSVYTLVYDQECGVVLKLLWPELPAVEAHKELTEA